jgi:hypothetical protein
MLLQVTAKGELILMDQELLRLSDMQLCCEMNIRASRNLSLPLH